MIYKLLPHTKENIFGFDRNSAQMVGWEISKFDITKYWNKTTGKNVRIGVLDSGCDSTHDDLKDNIVSGYNTFTKSTDVNDDNGHGTHVAGTIAASNNKVGMVGVAPDATIVPIKVLDRSGSGSASNIADGINWAVDNGCEILTMSLASRHSVSSIERAMAYAHKNNVIVVCAAGNSGKNTSIMYPANSNNAIAVGAINQSLEICGFSCMGSELDFLSPGDKIFSCAPKNSYAIMSGTSMATPFAVGCIALTLSYLKSKNLSTSNIIDLLKNHSIKSNNYPDSQGIIRPLVTYD